MATNLVIIAFVGNRLTTFMQPFTLTNTDIKKAVYHRHTAPCLTKNELRFNYAFNYVRV